MIKQLTAVPMIEYAIFIVMVIVIVEAKTTTNTEAIFTAVFDMGSSLTGQAPDRTDVKTKDSPTPLNWILDRSRCGHLGDFTND